MLRKLQHAFFRIAQEYSGIALAASAGGVCGLVSYEAVFGKTGMLTWKVGSPQFGAFLIIYAVAIWLSLKYAYPLLSISTG